MTLDEYLKKKGSKSMRAIAKESKVSYTTLKAVRRGMKLKLYDVAKRVSEATDGKVSIEALCE